LAAVLQSTAQDGELVAAAGHVVAQSARAVRHVARALRAAFIQAEWHRTSPKVQLCIHAARPVRACIEQTTRPCAHPVVHS